MRSGGWQQTTGGDPRGRTLGLLGLGNIGSEVAKIGQAFGMRVLGWSKYLTAERAEAAGAALATKEELACTQTLPSAAEFVYVVKALWDG